MNWTDMIPKTRRTRRVAASLPSSTSGTNINAGWQKFNDYYMRLDDNLVFVAAVVLQQRMNRRYGI